MPGHTYLAPRLVVAAPQGRSGKTTVTLGLCAAFKARSLVVQPYKKGPDYIDPSWLTEAAGMPCRSLDPFFHEKPEALLRAFLRSAHKADLSIIEGNHGLFDSFDETGSGSTAAVARALDAPILLVVNTTRIGRSVAAIVYGCQAFESGTNIAGIVLNNVAHSRHEARMRHAIEYHCQVPVLGAIPRDEKLTIPDRHLGLVPRSEQETPLLAIAACKQSVERHLDMDAILEIARSASSAPALAIKETSEPILRSPGTKVGVLRDRAFTFYYPENLEALEEEGVELVFIDALCEAKLPAIDALYIGGGFPEMFMDELSANVALRMQIRDAIERDLPVYAECGGLMYLSRRIVWGQRAADMVGALPCEVEMISKPQGHGYVTARVERENPFFPPGTVLRGHEFHNSRIVVGPHNGNKGFPLPTAYSLLRGVGLGDRCDGILYRNVLASYTHLHKGGAPGWAKGLAYSARRYQEICQSAEIKHG